MVWNTKRPRKILGGEFGDKYIGRNTMEEWLPRRLALWAKILSRCSGIKSALEFGPNIGLNLRSLRLLISQIKLSGVEINTKAAEILRTDSFFGDGLKVYNTSALEFDTDEKFDMVMTLGVLIHINPGALESIYEKMYQFSNKYILMYEYYNPTPVSVSYRGESDRLFKRDFAGEFLDKYKDVSLVDYGFVYRRDNIFPDDDSTWFLMKKR